MSDLQLWTYIVVGVSFGLYLAIAIWARAGTTSEFYVAGKGVHPIANGIVPLLIGCLRLPSFLWRGS